MVYCNFFFFILVFTFKFRKLKTKLQDKYPQAFEGKVHTLKKGLKNKNINTLKISEKSLSRAAT